MVILINFTIVQFAPGGPVDITLAQIRNGQNGSGEGGATKVTASKQFGYSKNLDDELTLYVKALYGFDKPVHTRFIMMIKNYLTFDLGNSYYRNVKVSDLILEKLPVTMALGLSSTLIIYFIAIPLGIRKALQSGKRFDHWTTLITGLAYALPSFLLAIILIAIFAGDGALSYFPIRAIVSTNWHELTIVGKITDFIWHMVLPVTTLVITGFATITMLTKNSFLEELHKQYVTTARAKGLTESKILYGHVFRNAMLIVITGIPEVLINVLLTGALLTEIIFSLEGVGLLGYEAAINRDYPVVFGTLYIFTLATLLANIVTDIGYVLIDPRINFERNN